MVCHMLVCPSKSTLIGHSLGMHLPLSIIRRVSRPKPDKILRSNRYLDIRVQLLSHVRQPTFEGYWICRGLRKAPVEPKEADVVIFYLHGGGYALGHPVSDAPNLLSIAESLTKEGLTTAVFAPRYTLTPEGRLPQQIGEVISAYKWLVQDLGVLPSRIALIGESAGGHLALSFLLELHLKTAHSRPSAGRLAKPAGAFLISPWCDLHNSNSRAINLRPGEVAFKRLLKVWGDFVMSGLNEQQQDMFVNFALGCEKRGQWEDILPSKTWISTGDDEVIFVHDIIDFVSAARDQSANVTLEIKPGGRHAWQTGAARPNHASFLDSEPGTECEGIVAAWRDLTASVAATFKGPHRLDEGLENLVHDASRERRVKRKAQ